MRTNRTANYSSFVSRCVFGLTIIYIYSVSRSVGQSFILCREERSKKHALTLTCLRLVAISEGIWLLIDIINIRKVNLYIRALVDNCLVWDDSCGNLRVVKLIFPMLMHLVFRRAAGDFILILHEVWRWAGLRQLLIYLLLVVDHGDLLL